jgi:hypothetical protein
MSSIFSPSYWEDRYNQDDSPWDLREASPPLVHFLNSWQDHHASVLIPGGGRGYELDWMMQQGFSKVKLIDWSQSALDMLKQRHPHLSNEQLICQDFFQHRQKYSLILEQTFFCALPPEMRPQYAAHMSELLSPNGVLAGVWFDFPLTEKGPPFGGSAAEYRQLLDPYFIIESISPCVQSHPSRSGKELFIIARRKPCLHEY